MFSKLKKGDYVILEKVSGAPVKPEVRQVYKIIRNEDQIYLKDFDGCTFSISDGSYVIGIRQGYRILPYEENSFKILLFTYEKDQCILALKTFIRDIPEDLDLNSFTVDQLKGFLSVAKIRSLVEKYEAQLNQMRFKMNKSLEILDKNYEKIIEELQ